MVECEFHNHSCCHCLEHHVEEAKRCHVSGMPTENSICQIPCRDDCEAVKEDS